MKTCARCSELKPACEFNKNSGAGDGLQAWCRTCSRAYNRSYKRRVRPADRHLRDRYKITAADLQRMLDEQGGACKLCGSAEPRGINWHVDHDHSCCPGRRTCGKCIRGILCLPCNISLGFREKENTMFDTYPQGGRR